MVCFDAEYIYSLQFFKLAQKYVFCFYEMGNIKYLIAIA